MRDPFKQAERYRREKRNNNGCSQAERRNLGPHPDLNKPELDGLRLSVPASQFR